MSRYKFKLDRLANDLELTFVETIPDILKCQTNAYDYDGTPLHEVAVPNTLNRLIFNIFSVDFNVVRKISLSMYEFRKFLWTEMGNKSIQDETVRCMLLESAYTVLFSACRHIWQALSSVARSNHANDALSTICEEKVCGDGTIKDRWTGVRGGGGGGACDGGSDERGWSWWRSATSDSSDAFNCSGKRCHTAAGVTLRNLRRVELSIASLLARDEFFGEESGGANFSVDRNGGRRPIDDGEFRICVALRLVNYIGRYMALCKNRIDTCLRVLKCSELSDRVILKRPSPLLPSASNLFKDRCVTSFDVKYDFSVLRNLLGYLGENLRCLKQYGGLHEIESLLFIISMFFGEPPHSLNFPPQIPPTAVSDTCVDDDDDGKEEANGEEGGGNSSVKKRGVYVDHLHSWASTTKLAELSVCLQRYKNGSVLK